MKTPLTRIFPTPNFLSMPSVGLDFSDYTLRFVNMVETPHGIIPKDFGQVSIPKGCMDGGRIVNSAQFIDFLSTVRKKYKLKYVRVAVPESQVYSFTLSLSIEASSHIKSAIELVLEDYVPLKAPETIFDYHILNSDDKSILLQVVALSNSVSRSYFDAFISAGMVPISFELDGQAITRAVLDPKDSDSYMVVDFGAYRTGITIISNKTAVYTSSLEFGGKLLINNLVKELNISEEEAQKIKNNYGLSNSDSRKEIFSILAGSISILRDEINKRYVYWQEKRNQYTNFKPIETIYLCGGHSNLPGLADYLKSGLKLNVVRVNPWINCLSLDEIVPKMKYEDSMSYVTAIGLSLAEYIYD